MERSVRIAEDIRRRTTGANYDVIMILTGGSMRMATRLKAALDQSQLVPAIPDGPVATSSADDFDLLEQGALIPLKANLRNLSVRIECNEVRLKAQSQSVPGNEARAHWGKRTIGRYTTRSVRKLSSRLGR